MDDRSMDGRNNGTAEAREDAARRVRDAADTAVKDVKQAAVQGVEDARAKVGDTGHTTASRLRELAGQVEGDMPWMATAFTKSAEGLDSVTDSLTKGDLNQCLAGVSDFARRQPAIFLGASVALGFALARVGKAALDQPEAHPETDREQERTPFDGVSGSYATGTEI